MFKYTKLTTFCFDNIIYLLLYVNLFFYHFENYLRLIKGISIKM